VKIQEFFFKKKVVEEVTSRCVMRRTLCLLRRFKFPKSPLQAIAGRAKAQAHHP